MKLHNAMTNAVKITGLITCLMVTGCTALEDLNPFSEKPPSNLTLEDKLALINSNMSEQVDLEFDEAIQAQDYRLYASAGRRIIVVGIENQSVEMLKQKCGIKFIPNSGDVLRGENDKEVRRVKFKFAMLYNLKMHPYCLENK